VQPLAVALIVAASALFALLRLMPAAPLARLLQRLGRRTPALARALARLAGRGAQRAPSAGGEGCGHCAAGPDATAPRHKSSS
jgi:hypothetical protein